MNIKHVAATIKELTDITRPLRLPEDSDSKGAMIFFVKKSRDLGIYTDEQAADILEELGLPRDACDKDH
jgi:hypothetical protein